MFQIFVTIHVLDLCYYSDVSNLCYYPCLSSLTVEEHLYFYGGLKGISKEALSAETSKMIVDLGLPHKREALADDLSGNYFIFILNFVSQSSRMKISDIETELTDTLVTHPSF